MYAKTAKAEKIPATGGKAVIYPNGYVYWITKSEWDKTKKRTVDNRVCIGKKVEDKEGWLYPNERFFELFQAPTEEAECDDGEPDYQGPASPVTVFRADCDIDIGENRCLSLLVEDDPSEEDGPSLLCQLQIVNREDRSLLMFCHLDAEALRLMASCLETAVDGNKKRIHVWTFYTQYEAYDEEADDDKLIEVRFHIESCSALPVPAAMVAIERVQIDHCGTGKKSKPKKACEFSFLCDTDTVKALVATARTTADGLAALQRNWGAERRLALKMV